ncbi:NADH-quinone oxidoreductase subunit NuoN [Sulfurospirillum sp. T05]|uniref:NADH-quinone oxidoreductase subunit N n=1 Tax=Sulfurospirillum tamanense TaxID=2813362 RepID=A0ABS2WQR9_9BACT|nr:NADH-quinone oxidoreductase subunit NuoN [Sulfurospirillum tamanensis]MBN2963958.1 NADH-quinone oxidoreductase subunit NuoN [Sulfurospirillum tamanensis]
MPISIDLATLNMATVMPTLILVIGALAILCIDLFKRDLSRSFYTMIAVLVMLLSIGATLGLSGSERGFFDMMLMDGIAVISGLIILVTSVLFVPLALSSKRFHEFTMPEFFALFLFMVAGFLFMVSSDNLILIFIGLETASLALYTMIAMHNRLKAIEAAIKYFTMGALAAGFYAFSALLFYALTGSVEIGVIVNVLYERGFDPMIGVLGATVFMLAALGFKLSIIPFHTWTPDVYEGSSAALAGYMSIVPKIAGFVVAMRLFEMLAQSGVVWLEDVLFVAVVLTMTLANLMALVQTDVKRMLAFSSISHAGFVLAAILIGTTQANVGFFLYWMMFLFTNLGAFSMLWIARNKQNLWDARYQHPFTKFSGMVKVSPMAATIMGVFMFSLAGIPPFSIFWGKLFLMSAAVNAGYIGLAVIMAINSAIAVYYYMKLVVFMFLKDPIAKDGSVYAINASTPLKSIIGFALVMTLCAVLFVDSLIGFIAEYVIASGF